MKWLSYFFILLIAILGGALIAPSFIDWSQYKNVFKTQITQFTGLNAEFKGDISLAILPSPRVYLSQVEITNPEQGGALIGSFELLDVRVGLGALINGQVDVESVHIKKPVIEIFQNSKGQLNYSTDKINKLSSAGGKGTGAAKPSAAQVKISSINIEEGRFSYNLGGNKGIVDDVALTLKADNLFGPYAGETRFVYNNQKFKLDFKTGALDLNKLTTSLNLKGYVDDIYELNYAGVVSGGDKPSIKGEVSASAKINPYPVSISGFASANTEKVSLTDSRISVGEYAFKGRFDGGLNPMSVKGSFELMEALNLDRYIAKNSTQVGQGNGSILAPLDLLPKSLTLPAIAGVDVNFSVPDVIYKGQSFGAASLKFDKIDKGFQTRIVADEIPQSSSLQLNTKLVFAEKSVINKTNTELYTEPSLDIVLSGQSADIYKVLKGLVPAQADMLCAFKKAVIEMKLNASPGVLNIKQVLLNLDKDAYSLTGSLSDKAGHSLPLLNMDFVAEEIDLSKLTAGSNNQGGNNANGNFELPFDALLSANIHRFVLSPEQVIKGPKFKANANNGLIKISQFSADDLMGNKFALDSDIDVKLNGEKPLVKGDVKLGDFKWVSPKAQVKQKSTSERWSSEPLDLSGLKSFDMDLSVSANSLQYDRWSFSKPKMKLILNDGTLDVSGLEAGLYGGKITGGANVSALSKGGAIKSDFALKDVDMSDVVRSFVGNNLIKGSGNISLDGKVLTQGASIKDLVGSLSGQGGIDGTKIVIDGIDVQRFVRAMSDDAKPGDTVLNLWKGVATRGSSSFDSLNGGFNLVNGDIQIKDTKLDGERAYIHTTGTVNLLKWSLNTVHKMGVKDRDDVPEFSVNLSGPLDNPASTFGQGLLNDYLQRKIQRKLQNELGNQLDKALNLDGVLKGVLGGGAQKKPANDNQQGSDSSDNKQQQKPATAEDAVQELLESLF